MKKYSISFLLIIGIFLVGCAENPALKGMKEEAVRSPDSIENEPDNQESHGESEVPTVDIGTEEKSTLVALDVWCWKEESLCSLKPNPPEEQLYGWEPLGVEPGEVFSFSISTSGQPKSDHIYNPDSVELTQVNFDEEKKVEVNNRQITAPMEKGRYYYYLKLQWDGDLVGQAYYVFGIIVQ